MGREKKKRRQRDARIEEETEKGEDNQKVPEHRNEDKATGLKGKRKGPERKIFAEG